jgi:hypothetical protein
MISNRECKTLYLANTRATEFTEMSNGLIKGIQFYGNKSKHLKIQVTNKLKMPQLVDVQQR